MEVLMVLSQLLDTKQTPWSQLRANQRKGLQGKSLRKYCCFHELSRNIVQYMHAEHVSVKW